MKCLRCHNTEPHLFFQNEGRWYCRRCLDFGKLEAGQKPIRPPLTHSIHQVTPKLEFALTPAQQQVSRQALACLHQGKDVLIYAAAGAGKTEITLESICAYLRQGKKVGFAISRRQVVIEIAARLAANFPALKVVPVCAGFTSVTDGDLIVCTTHQLYRYPFCFDLLILDELDAFPYAGNQVLEAIADQSCIGQKLLLSATPDEKNLQACQEGKMEMLQLFARPHGHALCIPRVYYGSKFLLVVRLLWYCRQFIAQNKQVLLFVPRIADTWWMKKTAGLFFRCLVIHSKSEKKDEIMADFHARKAQVLICTTLLERGITVPSVQVIVYRADHPVFTRASLIQIFGRVGRSFSDPEGKGIALCEHPSQALQGCIDQLMMMNSARGVSSPSTPARALKD